ncbi:hypothetical protein BJY00DRAFT_107203 [Aspergillus carlsbadensis]|nr:hypothetical protein BJY00DRAFT_107203 [Aspergillus carlsbadensis]
MSSVSRTCQSCADSKVRCVRNVDPSGACDRCCRLGRECLNRQTGRRFKGFQKDRKIAALESKINELMVNRPEQADGNGNPRGMRSNSLEKSDAASEDVISRDFLDIETAERYLKLFKTKLIPHFPFVVVPQDISIKQLRQKKPFLCLAILASASYENMPLQRALGAQFKKAVASRLIIGGEISFELLQGLMVFLAWSHYHSRPHRYTQFLQLAISLVVDLRLDRPPQTETWKTALRFDPQNIPQEQTLNRPSWGSDEQRAVLGCYYLSSSIAMLVQKKSTILRSPYHEDCCKSLLEVNEHPHDKYIHYVIQLQFITEKIDQMSTRHGPDLEKPGSGSELYIANLKSDLEAFYRHLPFDVHESTLLAIQYHTTGLCLYQIALNITRPRSHADTEPPSWIEEMAISAVVSANSILDLYLQLSPNEEAGFNNTQWVQMGFALLVACRHNVAASKPDRVANFLHTLTKLQSRLEALSTTNVDENGARDVFFDFKNRVIRIQNRLARLDRQEDDAQTQVHSGAFQHTPYSEPTDFDRLEGAEGHTDINMWNLLTFPAEDLLASHDDFSPSSFEQMMGDWI